MKIISYIIHNRRKNCKDRNRCLREELDWYTFYATPDQFDPERVIKILSELDELDPSPRRRFGDIPKGIPDPYGVYALFQKQHLSEKGYCEEYPIELITEPEKLCRLISPVNRTLPRKNIINFVPSEKRTFQLKNTSYAAAALFGLVSAIVAWSLFNMSTTLIADQEKNFFEIEKDEENGMKITITGNDADRTYYDNWTGIQAIYPDIMIPEYIPEGVELTELSRQTYDNITLYSGIYTQSMIISVWDYTGVFDRDLLRDWELLDSVDGISFYSRNDRFRAVLETAHCIYTVDWTDLVEVKKIAYGLTGTLIQIP